MIFVIGDHIGLRPMAFGRRGVSLSECSACSNRNYIPGKRTNDNGKPTMNEDVSPTKN